MPKGCQFLQFHFPDLCRSFGIITFVISTVSANTLNHTSAELLCLKIYFIYWTKAIALGNLLVLERKVENHGIIKAGKDLKEH